MVTDKDIAELMDHLENVIKVENRELYESIMNVGSDGAHLQCHTGEPEIIHPIPYS